MLNIIDEYYIFYAFLKYFCAFNVKMQRISKNTVFKILSRKKRESTGF